MHSLGIVQWNSTRRDHPGNPGGVSGSGPVTVAKTFFFFYVNIPCMKCEDSYRVLKFIYHGLIYAIGNMDGRQNNLFFLC